MHDDLSNLSPDQRRAELARILALGVLRWHHRQLDPPSPVFVWPGVDDDGKCGMSTDTHRLVLIRHIRGEHATNRAKADEIRRNGTHWHPNVVIDLCRC